LLPKLEGEDREEWEVKTIDTNSGTWLVSLRLHTQKGRDEPMNLKNKTALLLFFICAEIHYALTISCAQLKTQSADTVLQLSHHLSTELLHLPDMRLMKENLSHCEVQPITNKQTQLSG
jgi:hypothetical protein